MRIIRPFNKRDYVKFESKTTSECMFFVNYMGKNYVMNRLGVAPFTIDFSQPEPREPIRSIIERGISKFEKFPRKKKFVPLCI